NLITSGAVAVFDDKNVGADKTVTFSGYTITGDDAANYTLTQPTSAATITPKTLTVTGITASDKYYDGTTVATIDKSGAVLVGVCTLDEDVTLNKGSATGQFASAAKGTGITVSIRDLYLTG